MGHDDDTTKSNDPADIPEPSSEKRVVTKLSEEEQKRIFSCIPEVVKDIETWIEHALEAISSSALSDEDKQEMYKRIYPQIKDEGIKLDKNNRVVKIKHNSAWLGVHLLEKGIIPPNPYTFYIGSHRDGIDGEPNSPSSLDSLKSSDSDDSLASLDSSGSADSRKVFAKLSKKHTSNQKSVAKLGEGTFGQVKLVTTGDQKCAMKKIDLNLGDEEKKQTTQKEIENEIQALKIMGQYKDHKIIDGFMYIYMDYISGVSLQDKLTAQDDTVGNAQGKLEEAEKCLIAEQLVDELMKLHAAGLFHRDIKPGNVIYDAKGHKATFIDFGSTKKYVRGETSWSDIEDYVFSHIGMTPGYVPLESGMVGGTLDAMIRNMPQKPQTTTEDEQINIDQIEVEPWTAEQKIFLETQYAPHAYAKIDIYQLGKVFSDMGLPKQLWESMMTDDPLQRPSLEIVKKNIQQYKDSLSQEQQSLSVTDKLQPLQELENMWSQTSSTLTQRDTTDLQKQLLARQQQQKRENTQQWPATFFEVTQQDKGRLQQRLSAVKDTLKAPIETMQKVRNKESQADTLKQRDTTDLQKQLLTEQQPQEREKTEKKTEEWPAIAFAADVKQQDKGRLKQRLAVVKEKFKDKFTAPIVNKMQKVGNTASQRLGEMKSKINSRRNNKK